MHEMSLAMGILQIVEDAAGRKFVHLVVRLSLIHISEPTRPY